VSGIILVAFSGIIIDVVIAAGLARFYPREKKTA